MLEEARAHNRSLYLMSDIGKDKSQYEKHSSRIGIQVRKMDATVEGSLLVNMAGLANSLSLPIRP
jgi:hypothetical protein